MSNIDLPSKALFRLDEVAQICEVPLNTVRRWIDQGLLRWVTFAKVSELPEPKCGWSFK